MRTQERGRNNFPRRFNILRGIMNTINEQPVAEKKNSKWAIRPLVPSKVYTDRQEHIDYLYNTTALAAMDRRTMSTVLLGLPNFLTNIQESL